MTKSGITLRPCAPEHADFLYRLYANTRSGELAAIGWNAAQQEPFLRQQFAARQQQYAWFDPAPEDLIIMKNEEAIGRLMVQRSEHTIKLVDIELLPKYRNAGIGSQLIRGLQDEAARACKEMLLHIETGNRARRLYERLGFAVTAADGMYYAMLWQPNNA